MPLLLQLDLNMRLKTLNNLDCTIQRLESVFKDQIDNLGFWMRTARERNNDTARALAV